MRLVLRRDSLTNLELTFSCQCKIKSPLLLEHIAIEPRCWHWGQVDLLGLHMHSNHLSPIYNTVFIKPGLASPILISQCGLSMVPSFFLSGHKPIILYTGVNIKLMSYLSWYPSVVLF